MNCPKCGTFNSPKSICCINCDKLLPTDNDSKNNENTSYTKNHDKYTKIKKNHNSN